MGTKSSSLGAAGFGFGFETVFLTTGAETGGCTATGMGVTGICGVTEGCWQALSAATATAEITIVTFLFIVLPGLIHSNSGKKGSQLILQAHAAFLFQPRAQQACAF